MAKAFLALSPTEQREVLEVAASKSGRPLHLLEKDIWVVWSLAVLFEADFGKHLVFKGGTSLSKAYGAIRRFSEDVDLTYDIRALAPDLAGDTPDPLPVTRSEEKRWTSTIRKRLPVWVAETVLPVIVTSLSAMGIGTRSRAEGEKVFIAYEPLAQGSSYVRPEVMLEFGARSTGEPCTVYNVDCDAAGLIEGVMFPTAKPRVMRAERTFWEKATAVHVYCKGGRIRGERFARHWYDLVRLDDAGIAAIALADRELARAVARHKSMFFAERTTDGQKIDYHAAVEGGLLLVPDHDAHDALAEDYRRMIEDGLLLDEAEPFHKLMEHCRDIQDLANN